MTFWLITASVLYLSILFLIAYWGDRRAEQGRSIISNPYVYSLSMAVYCTAWTFYGSVGRAAESGFGFLPIYIGPTLMAVLWWTVLRKMVRITRTWRITTLADFIASRYGKSVPLGAIVTIFIVIGISTYLSLKLKAVAATADLLTETAELDAVPIFLDGGLYIAILMAIFVILFGTRKPDVTEKHEGMVAAVAFESIVKLLAFLIAGFIITYIYFSGPGIIFSEAMKNPDWQHLFQFSAFDLSEWFWISVVSMMAILFLPRQFQVAVLEVTNESHIKKARWMFPLYLLIINIFVLPVALAGMLMVPDGVDVDLFLLAIPLAAGDQWLALLVFIGGLSAATSMVIVAAKALSTMISNDLVLPLLFRVKSERFLKYSGDARFLLNVRRISIVLILLLSYLYFRSFGEDYSLVAIGLISFTAVSQLAPPILGGMYWKKATAWGAMAGLLAGFTIWFFILIYPAIEESRLIQTSVTNSGFLGVSWLRPHTFLGITSYNPVPLAVFWSLSFNFGFYVLISLLTRPGALEISQASRFVDVYTHSGSSHGLWKASASVGDLRQLTNRFLGPEAAEQVFADYNRSRLSGTGLTFEDSWESKLPEDDAMAEPGLIGHVERHLSGVMGSAAARMLLFHVVKEEPLTPDEMLEVIEETRQVYVYSKELENKSKALEETTRELRQANEKLTELDHLKDEFISTITHELRTPLTSIRAFTEIMYDNPDIDNQKKQDFLGRIRAESERLTRFINQVLDLQKLETADPEKDKISFDLSELMREMLDSMSAVLQEKNIEIISSYPEEKAMVFADRDRIARVILNLLSNAFRFSDPGKSVSVGVRKTGEMYEVSVEDSGPGINRGGTWQQESLS